MCLCVVYGVSCVDGGSQFLKKKRYVENGGGESGIEEDLHKNPMKKMWKGSTAQRADIMTFLRTVPWAKHLNDPWHYKVQGQRC